MSNDPATRPGPQRAAVLFPPPIGQTPVDVRLPHRLAAGLARSGAGPPRGRPRVAREQEAEERASYMWEWDVRAMDDDELDDRS